MPKPTILKMLVEGVCLKNLGTPLENKTTFVCTSFEYEAPCLANPGDTVLILTEQCYNDLLGNSALNIKGN